MYTLPGTPPAGDRHGLELAAVLEADHRRELEAAHLGSAAKLSWARLPLELHVVCDSGARADAAGRRMTPQRSTQ